MKTAALTMTATLMLLAQTAFADTNQGQVLVQKHGCLGCHQVERRIVGPAYKEVARKYKDDDKAEEHLVHVIQKGGKGVWGAIPMPAMPSVSEDDARTIAQWILQLK